MDEATQKKLARGTRLREVLKQPQNSPLSVPQQVALIYAGINGFLDELAVNDVKKYCSSLLDYLKIDSSEKIDSSYITLATQTLKFSDEVEASLVKSINESKEAFMNSNKLTE